MIQVNLLPKVKLDYIKARKNQRLAMFISFVAAAGSLFILVSLFIVVNVVQKKHSSDLTRDISSEASKLQSINDLDKILTIQNQLNSLSQLHDKKPVASRLSTYIERLTPNKVTIDSFEVDYIANTIKITGASEQLSRINQFVDTIKFSSFKTVAAPDEKPAFSNVVLADFSKDEEGATYEITANFDPIIFASTETIDLIVPQNKVTTRSETEKPSALFQQNPETEEEQQ